MSAQKRKRSNAFEDFPNSETQNSQEQPGGSLFTNAVPVSDPQVERIERLKPSEMMPDRYQPRRLLPMPLRARFFSGQINCYQAAAEWLELAAKDPVYQIEVDRLINMGGSFEEHGQIKPITGSWLSNSDGKFVFMIETGERRFWAACLRYIIEKVDDEPLLRVEVVNAPTRQRQVLENRHAEPPSAVSQSCEIASLILAEMKLTVDGTEQDEYDYFRKARSQRMPAGLWDRIIPIMQLTRPRMVQLLNILQLPSPLLELADRYRLPERVLREILALPSSQWERMIRLSGQNNLTSDDIVEISDSDKQKPARTTEPPPTKSTHEIASRDLRRFHRGLNKLTTVELSQALDEIADNLVVKGEAESVLQVLEELAALLRVRTNQ